MENINNNAPNNSDLRHTGNFEAALAKVENDCPLIGFVRLPVLVKLLGVSKTTIYKEIREGRFPQHVRISPRVSAWRISDLKEHFDQLTNKPSE